MTARVCEDELISRVLNVLWDAARADFSSERKIANSARGQAAIIRSIRRDNRPFKLTQDERRSEIDRRYRRRDRQCTSIDVLDAHVPTIYKRGCACLRQSSSDRRCI